MEPIFREVQRFRQNWLWLVVGVTFAMSMGGVVFAMVMQPAGGKGALPTGALVAIFVFTSLIEGGILWLLVSAHLIVEVDDAELRLQFFPFHRSFRRIPFNDIEEHAAVEYRPLAEYGGWGIRGFKSNRAYNVSGNRGVRMKLRDGNRLLLGSQRAEELDAAIARADKR
jgi:hypothetical protein